jgi:hypothetical protein
LKRLAKALAHLLEEALNQHRKTASVGPLNLSAPEHPGQIASSLQRCTKYGMAHLKNAASVLPTRQ